MGKENQSTQDPVPIQVNFDEFLLPDTDPEVAIKHANGSVEEVLADLDSRRLAERVRREHLGLGQVDTGEEEEHFDLGKDADNDPEDYAPKD